MCDKEPLYALGAGAFFYSVLSSDEIVFSSAGAESPERFGPSALHFPRGRQITNNEEEEMKKKMSRTLAVLMCLMTAVAFMPTFAFAEDGAAITVYLTVSNEGSLAKANDGSAMAWKEVKVKNTDNDPHYSFDEALTAAHEAYNSVDNYGAKEDSVSKLWGVSTTNVWFSVNGKGLKSGVSSDDVQDGDYITAQINTDNELYSDWYSEFDKKTVTVKEGESVSLNLSGYQGSTAYMDDALKKIKGASVGVWNGGSMTGAKATDDNGDVSLSFDKAGTYVVTAKGAVPATVDASLTWTLMESSRDKDDKTIYGKMDWTTYDSFIGYTEKDYGEGPYPWNEIQWVDLTEFDKASWDYDSKHLLYSGNVIRECPIMAPACIVTVEHGKYVHDKVAAGYLTNGYECDKCEICGDVKNYIHLPGWSTNYVKSFRVSKGKKSFTAKWKKQSKKNRKKFSGYQIRYAKNSQMTGAVYKNVSKSSKSKKIRKLSKKTTYYVQVRSYTYSKGVKYYAGWSKVKAVKTR